MDTMTVPNSATVTVAEAITPAINMAVAMAIQLDEIRQIYGDECAMFVTSSLRESANPRWEEVTYNALKRWTSQHPRLVLDLDS